MSRAYKNTPLVFTKHDFGFPELVSNVQGKHTSRQKFSSGEKSRKSKHRRLVAEQNMSLASAKTRL